MPGDRKGGVEKISTPPEIIEPKNKASPDGNRVMLFSCEKLFLIPLKIGGRFGMIWL